MKIKVVNNFLEDKIFDSLCRLVLYDMDFPWSYTSGVAHDSLEGDQNGFYFVHPIFEDGKGFATSSSELRLRLKPLSKLLDMKQLLRARLLLYVNQGEQIVHDKHIDFDESHHAFLLYLNSNNGYTEFHHEDKPSEKVTSTKNRAVLFDGSKPHNSSTPTNTRRRVVLAVNYL